MSVFRTAVLALFSCLLSGCGGGGGGGGSGAQPPNGTVEFRVSLDRTALTFLATAGGAPPSQTIMATWTGTPPDPVYITATVEGAGISPTIPVAITSSSATATVSVANGLSAGNYTGRINFLVCRDSACNQRVGGSPLPVNFTVNVSAAPGSSTPPTPPPPPSSGGGTVGGEFTLSATQLAFTGRQFQAPPASQLLQLHLSSAQQVTVAAAFANTTPNWASVSIGGQAPDYQLTVRILNSNGPVGTRSAVLAVATVDASGNVLQRKDVTVTLQTLDVIRGYSPNIYSSFVLGSSASSFASNVNVIADPVTAWTVSTSDPWVSTSLTSGTGNAAVGVRIDASNLDVGTHSGSVTITNNSDPTNTVRFAVNAMVMAPTISISTGPIVIGGTDGLGTAGANIVASINSGTNSHPWTATATTANGERWLIPAASGLVGSTPTNIGVDADRALVEPGVYEGTVSVQFNVRGHTYSHSVPVVLNKEGHWLQASAHGAAFSSFPARSVLSRSVEITSTRGRTDVPWSASSDASWLTVTPSGTTGGTLILTADPTGLPQDTTHIANVTIASSDPSIQNQESIRVALWASATDPQDVKLTGGQHTYVVANPVEPWAYTNSGTETPSTIRVYNVYTGALLSTWTPTAITAADMEISQDGKLLFVNDAGSHLILALDARTGNTVQSYAYSQYSSSTGIAYINAGGKPTLIAGIGSIYDVASGVQHDGSINAGWYGGMLSFAVDSNNRHLFTQNMGLSGSTASKFSIKRTALNDDAVVVTPIRENSGGSNGQDLCVSSDGERVYTANGWPYVFSEFAASSFDFIRQLPGDAYPNNTVCGWNGLFLGGADAYYYTQDIWVYRADGSLLTAFKLGDAPYTSAGVRTVVLSGDNTRVIGYAYGSLPGVPGLVFKNVPAP